MVRTIDIDWLSDQKDIRSLTHARLLKMKFWHLCQDAHLDMPAKSVRELKTPLNAREEIEEEFDNCVIGALLCLRFARTQFLQDGRSIGSFPESKLPIFHDQAVNIVDIVRV